MQSIDKSTSKGAVADSHVYEGYLIFRGERRLFRFDGLTLVCLENNRESTPKKPTRVSKQASTQLDGYTTPSKSLSLLNTTAANPLDRIIVEQEDVLIKTTQFITWYIKINEVECLRVSTDEKDKKHWWHNKKCFDLFIDLQHGCTEALIAESEQERNNWLFVLGLAQKMHEKLDDPFQQAQKWLDTPRSRVQSFQSISELVRRRE